MSIKTIINRINESIEMKEKILKDTHLIEQIDTISQKLIGVYRSNKKVILFGNGGSAADAQHLAAELMNKFYFDRNSLPAIALTVNTSILTAVGNDYSFKKIFSKQLEGIGNEEDAAIGISTSGNSINVIEGLKYAKRNKLYTIAFTGKNGGGINHIVDECIKVPSDDTPRIQEGHIMIGHIICEIIEKELFKKNER